MSDLVAWLGHILDEDEAYASQIGAPDGYYPDPYDPGSPLRHEALLADIAAKRAIIAHMQTRRERVQFTTSDLTVLCILASAYADRSGYRDEWKP